MSMGKVVDRFWVGIFLTVTIMAIIFFSGYVFGLFGTPFFILGFNLENLDLVAIAQVAFVAIMMGATVAWLRKNSKVMRRM